MNTINRFSTSHSKHPGQLTPHVLGKVNTNCFPHSCNSSLKRWLAGYRNGNCHSIRISRHKMLVVVITVITPNKSVLNTFTWLTEVHFYKFLGLLSRDITLSITVLQYLEQTSVSLNIPYLSFYLLFQHHITNLQWDVGWMSKQLTRLTKITVDDKPLIKKIKM